LKTHYLAGSCIPRETAWTLKLSQITSLIRRRSGHLTPSTSIVFSELFCNRKTRGDTRLPTQTCASTSSLALKLNQFPRRPESISTTQRLLVSLWFACKVAPGDTQGCARLLGCGGLCIEASRTQYSACGHSTPRQGLPAFSCSSATAIAHNFLHDVLMLGRRSDKSYVYGGRLSISSIQNSLSCALAYVGGFSAIGLLLSVRLLLPLPERVHSG
jgi:hypothetical protein